LLSALADNTLPGIKEALNNAILVLSEHEKNDIFVTYLFFNGSISNRIHD